MACGAEAPAPPSAPLPSLAPYDASPPPPDTGVVAATREPRDLPFRRTPPTPHPATAFVPPSPTRLELHNRIPVLVVAAESNVCALDVVAAGRVAEPGDARGRGADVASLTLATMVLGTKERDRNALDAEYMNLFVPEPEWHQEYDALRLSMNSPKDQFVRAAGLLAEIVLRPRFDPSAAARAREHRARRLDDSGIDPANVAEYVLLRAAFARHPYGQFPTAATTRTVTLAELVALYGRRFDPTRLSLVAVCDLPPEEIVTVLDKSFGAVPVSGPRAAAPAAPPVTAIAPGPRLVVVDKPGTAVSAIDGALLGPAPDVPAYDVARLGWAVLANNGVGRLNSRLRQELQLVPWVSELFYAYRSCALLGFRTRATNEHVADVLAEVDRILRDFAARGPSEEELETTRASVGLSFASGFLTVSETARIYGHLIEQEVPIEWWLQTPRRRTAVTPQDVRDFAARAFTADRMRIVVVGDLAAVRQPLLALGWGPIEVRDEAGAVIRTEQRGVAR